MSLNPKRTILELKELRELTADANGAQRLAWSDTWLKARAWTSPKCWWMRARETFIQWRYR